MDIIASNSFCAAGMLSLNTWWASCSSYSIKIRNESEDDLKWNWPFSIGWISSSLIWFVWSLNLLVHLQNRMNDWKCRASLQFLGNLITISPRICQVLKKKKKETVGEGQIKPRLAFTNCFSFLVRKCGRIQRSWYSYLKKTDFKAEVSGVSPSSHVGLNPTTF